MFIKKDKCNHCNGELIEQHTRYTNNNEKVYEERCSECGNLVYGWVKKIK